MDVSVIIPTYNRAHCIADAIQSALAQTVRPAEVIVVDDGSTDGTADVLERFGDSIQIIRQKNSGVSSARNAGLQVARAEWVAFLDSDDLWKPSKLEIQASDVERYPQSIGHMIDAEMIGYGQDPISLFKIRNYHEVVRENPLRLRPLAEALAVQFFTPTWMLRRDAILKAGPFRTDFTIYEDFELLTRVALQGPFVVNSSSGVIVRRMPAGADPLSNQHLTASAQSLANLCTIYEGLLQAGITPEERSEISRRLSGARFQLSIAQAADGNHWVAHQLRWQSVRDRPSLKAVTRAFLSQVGAGPLWSRIASTMRSRGTIRRSELDRSRNHVS